MDDDEDDDNESIGPIHPCTRLTVVIHKHSVMTKTDNHDMLIVSW